MKQSNRPGDPQTATLPQLDASGPISSLRIYYPDGHTRDMPAVWRGQLNLQGESYVMLAVPSTNENAMAAVYNELECLDPLCVVVDLDTWRVLYQPRLPEVFERLAPVTRELLAALPHWPAELELWPSPVENGQARIA